jgi:FkbM family methyltransferase
MAEHKAEADAFHEREQCGWENFAWLRKQGDQDRSPQEAGDEAHIHPRKTKAGPMYQIKRSLGLHFIIRSESVVRRNLRWMSRSDSVDLISLRWMGGSMFLQTLRETRLTLSDCILDLGAHIGTFALPAVAEKGCRAHCYEPDAESLRVCRANAVLNDLDHLVEFHQCAVAGSDGTAVFHESDKNWAHTLLESGGPHNRLTGVTHEVAMVSLDTVLRDVPASARVFVKFNIEGAEYAMLANASMPALARIEALVGEVHYDLGQSDFSPCVARLQEAGFTVDLVSEGDLRAIMVARRA